MMTRKTSSTGPGARAARTTGLVLAGALTLTACGGDINQQDAEAGEGHAGTSAVTVFNGATGTINENWNPFSPTALQPTLGVLYEPLYWYNLAQDSEPRPMLATDHSWNEDGTELTITVRDGVTWSDGEPLTAEDVAFTFNLLRDAPELNTSGLEASAEVVDETTVRLAFEEPSFMEEASVLGNQAIVPEHVWSDIEDPTTTINPDPVGTGAFTLKDFTAQSYVLEARDDYWGEDGPHIDEVRYVSLDTADAATAALTSGEVDWMSSFLPGLEDILDGHDELTWVNTPAMTTSIFTCSDASLGCEGPQTDRAVRQAIHRALDRQQLNELAGAGFAEEASPTMLLPERDASWIADDDLTTVPQSPNVKKAREILEEAGWTEGDDGIRTKDGEKLSMSIQTVSGWSDFITLTDTMAQQLEEVGIELRPTQMAWNEWNDNQTKGEYQLSLDSIGLGASSNPYFTYEPRYASYNTAEVGEASYGQNWARYQNDVVDEAIEAARLTQDEEAQAEQYAIIQEEIAEDLPYIPVYINSTLTEFNTSHATGWPTNEDPYAFAASWKSWDNGIVLQRIEPAE